MIAVRHRAALLSAVLAVVAATLALPGRASAAEPGFEVAITELPATFGAGAGARDVTVVVSTDVNRCQKVRWSLLLQAEGADLDDVSVGRIEADGDFPVQVEADGDTARITDRQLDPGQLCRGRTVTARYRIALDEDADSGRLTFQAQAFNAAGTLLQDSTAGSQVVGQQQESAESPSADPTPSPSESSPEPEESATDEQPQEPEPEASVNDIAAVPTAGSGTPSLLGPGLIIGGVLVFLGVGLLLRLRLRTRDTKRGTELPTSFYPTR
jgi:hypothetical protein